MGQNRGRQGLVVGIIVGGLVGLLAGVGLVAAVTVMVGALAATALAVAHF